MIKVVDGDICEKSVSCPKEYYNLYCGFCF